jgi:hypothetical protein
MNTVRELMMPILKESEKMLNGADLTPKCDVLNERINELAARFQEEESSEQPPVVPSLRLPEEDRQLLADSRTQTSSFRRYV